MSTALRACLIPLTLYAEVTFGFQYYEEPEPTPYLADIGPPPSCDYIIDTPAKWSQINSSSYRVFCVAPGDYTSVGKISLTANGTADTRRWIRLYDASKPNDTTHPYHLDFADRAIIRNLYITGDYWTIHRMSLDMTGGRSDTHLALLNNADHVIFDRVDAKNFPAGITFFNGASYGVVQKSTLHDNVIGYDAAAVQLHSWNYDGNHPVANCQFNRVVSNEIWNVGDGFQSIGGPNSNPEEDYRGTVIYNNDIYLSADRYTNCRNVLDPVGLCGYAENAIDIKSASDSAAEPFVIAHNRMWGFRFPDPAKAQFSDHGAAAIAHSLTRNLHFKGNILWDAPILFGAGGDTHFNLIMSGNLFHSPSLRSWTSWGGDRATTTSLAIGFRPQNVLIADNVFSEIAGGRREAYLILEPLASASADEMSFVDNVFIDADAARSVTNDWTVTIAGNEYYGSQVPPWETNALINQPSATGSVYDNEFCTAIKRITNPTQKCFPLSVHSAARSAPIPAPGNLRPGNP